MTSIDVLIDGQSVPIDRAVFTALLDNSVAGTYANYRKALDAGSIRYSDLVGLSRKGDIPFSLFFAPLPLVTAQVATKTRKLLAGVSKSTFQVGTRENVELRDVELIVKDLLRKQELLRRHDSTLEQNGIIGMLRKPDASPETDASRLAAALGLSHELIRAASTKQKALDLIISRVEANQILVSQSVQGFMPQRLTHVNFSGMTIRDTKIPYVFLAGGDHGDHQEPTGRKIFTLVLMTVLVARRIFAPVTWNGESTATGRRREYDIAGAMLMPAIRLREIGLETLADMKTASDEFKVTPSAITIRAMRLGLISAATARAHLAALREEFESRRQEPSGRREIKPQNAVRKYTGREFSTRMLKALDAGRVTKGEFLRVVCLNHLKPSQIGDLRTALA